MNTDLRLLLAIDIGTTNTKAALFQTDGSIVGFASRRHAVSTPIEGRAEHDAEKVWWEETRSVIKELTSMPSVDPRDIEGVGISSLSPALVALDHNGNALYPAMLYGLDRRAQNEIDELKELFGDKARISPLSIGPKILWLKKNEPEVFSKAAYFTGVPSFLLHRLTGNMVADYACQVIGGMPFSEKEMCWDEDMCRALGISPRQLPELKFGIETGGYVTEEAAEITGLCAGTPVAVGTGDFPAECCSFGTIYSSSIRLTFGTTIGVNFGYNSSDALFPGYSLSTRKKVRRGGALSNGCSSIDWITDLISGPGNDRLSDEQLNEYYHSSGAGADGIIFLPYLNGCSGAPVFRPDAKGVLFGLEKRHSHADIYRAALEGIAFSIRQMLLPAPDDVSTAVVLGGGCSIPGLIQTVSDVTGFTLTELDISDGALIGGAFLAGMISGVFKDLSDIDPWIKTKRIFHPDPENKDTYDQCYERFLRLYTVTQELL